MQSNHNMHQKRHDQSGGSLRNLYSYENDNQQQQQQQQQQRGQYAPHPYSTTPNSSRSITRNNHYNQQMSSSFDGSNNIPKMPTMQSMQKQQSMPSPINSHRSQRPPHSHSHPHSHAHAHSHSHSHHQQQQQLQQQQIRPNKHQQHQQPQSPQRQYHHSSHSVASPRSVHSAHSSGHQRVGHHGNKSQSSISQTQQQQQQQPQQHQQPPPISRSVSQPQSHQYQHQQQQQQQQQQHHQHHHHQQHHHHHHPHAHQSQQGHPSTVSANSNLKNNGTNYQNNNDPNLFTLHGILRIMKQQDPNYQMVTLGMDLTKLGGLDLNCAEPEIHHTFLSPWIEKWDDANKYITPHEYKVIKEDSPPTKFISKYKDSTLFYIFYSMVNDRMQVHSAKELYQRGWIYHKGLQLWLRKIIPQQPVKDNNNNNNNKEPKKQNKKGINGNDEDEHKISNNDNNINNNNNNNNNDKDNKNKNDDNNQKNRNKSGDKQSNNNNKKDDQHKVETNAKIDNKNDKKSKKNDDDEDKIDSKKINNKLVNGSINNKFEDKTEIFMKTVNVKEIEYFDVNEWKTKHFYSKFPINWNQEKRRLLHQHQLEYLFKSMYYVLILYKNM